MDRHIYQVGSKIQLIRKMKKSFWTWRETRMRTDWRYDSQDAAFLGSNLALGQVEANQADLKRQILELRYIRADDGFVNLILNS